MLPESPDDPLEQDAPDHHADDPAIASWFLAEGDRANPATDLRMFTTGNLVQPLIDGRSYFGRLCAELEATRAGDQVYLLDFRGDLDERLDGPGSEVGEILGLAARRGVGVFGLLWRSHPKALRQSEETNAEFVRRIDDDGGGQMLLDARTRRGGSHHQKLVVVRHPGAPEQDVAFVGGIDLGYSRNDDSRHLGDPQVMTFPDTYGRRPPWHDIQAEVRGPAVHDLEHTFRERWYGSSVLDVPSPLRQLYDRAYHMGAMTSRPLPEPAPDDRTRRGPHAIQVLRTYPARLRRYPFAPHGERSIAHAYRKAFARARCLVYVEDQYLWSRPVAGIIASALRDKPDLHVIAVVPRHPDNDGPITQMPGLLARHDVMRACTAAGGSRFAVYDLENHQRTPVYVHAKVVIVDDVWAMVGSDNLNRRSWSHDSELSIGVLDAELDAREPADPAGLGDGARTFARDLRLRLWREHLDRDAHDVADLLHPAEAFETFRRQAEQLAAWHETGRPGSRPPGRVSPHRCSNPTTAQRLWATPLYRIIYDPDGRPWQARLRGQLLPSVDRAPHDGTPDDTGERLARGAVRSGVDLVLASGGDGTVTACVGGVAGSGVPLGVLPCGTGNLLARNLALPLSLDEALTVALTGSDRRLDVGMANGRPFVVMAGIGFDAEMIDGADERLKNSVGWAAYVLSALRHLRERPVRMVLQADSGRPQRRCASGVIVGNVGSLQGNIQLLPDAVPDDGVLDVAVLAASGWAGWLRLAADVLLRRRTGRVAHLTCRELVIDASRARPWEVDGEVAGCTRQLRVTLEPGSLLIRVPAAARRLPARLSALPRLALWIAAQQQDQPPLGGLLGVVTRPSQTDASGSSTSSARPSDSPRWPGGEVKTSNPAPTTKCCRRGRSCRRCERARDLADGSRCR